MDDKIIAGSSLKKILSGLKAAKKKIVFTNGCFDIIHVGHITYLKKARKLGDILVIGLNSDSSVRAIKGVSRPINSEADRATVLAALYFIDYITIFPESTPEKLIKQIKPDVLVKGADWKIKDIVGADFVRSYGGTIARIPYIKGYSTTAILNKTGK